MPDELTRLISADLERRPTSCVEGRASWRAALAITLAAAALSACGKSDEAASAAEASRAGPQPTPTASATVPGADQAAGPKAPETRSLTDATPSTPEGWVDLNDDALAGLYARAADELDAGRASEEVRRALEGVGAHAKGAQLRANAWLALGSMAQDDGDLDAAVGWFEKVATSLPDEPAGHAVLALARAAKKDFEGALVAQERLVELDPDDLQAWLIWGELQVKAGHPEEAAKVYAGYEVRRKGLLDGLTLKKGEVYELRPEDRAGCARALGAAADNGTALALLYALSSDPHPGVRAALVEVMAEQRLEGYLEPLEHHLTVERDPDVKVLTLRAIGQIRAQPLQSRPGPSPVIPEGEAPAGESGQPLGAAATPAGTTPSGPAAPGGERPTTAEPAGEVQAGAEVGVAR